MIQDKRGIIYVGNRAGLLEFDGVYWRVIKIPNNTVRSLALHLDGTVYIGGINEMGFLTADEEGQAKYVSLVSHLDRELRNFGPVWRSHSTTEGVYFRTSNFLFRWNHRSGQIKVWQARSGFKASFACRQRLYIHDPSLFITMIALIIEYIIHIVGLTE